MGPIAGRCLQNYEDNAHYVFFAGRKTDAEHRLDKCRYIQVKSSSTNV